MIEYILAYALLNAMQTEAPRSIKPFEDRSACMAEAEKRNRTDERLRDKEVRALGGEFVCLKVERAGV